MIENIKELPPMAAGFLLSVVISVVRVIYDREETSFMRISLESLLCGALSLTAGAAISAMGYDQNWTLFAGGMIGFMGSQSIRAFAHRFVNKRI